MFSGVLGGRRMGLLALPGPACRESERPSRREACAASFIPRLHSSLGNDTFSRFPCSRCCCCCCCVCVCFCCSCCCVPPRLLSNGMTQQQQPPLNPTTEPKVSRGRSDLAARERREVPGQRGLQGGRPLPRPSVGGGRGGGHQRRRRRQRQ